MAIAVLYGGTFESKNAAPIIKIKLQLLRYLVNEGKSSPIIYAAEVI